jgi:transposase-like protein
MSERTEENSKKPDPQVSEAPEKASRRRFDAPYKLRILEEADGCTEPGQLGELLRREGLYSSHLTTWRKQRDEGALNGLREKKRGRKPKRRDAKDLELTRLRRDKQKLEERLRQAETIIEVQKKVSEILGIPLARPDDENT